MNNLSSYFGLVDAKIRASDKDLPVIGVVFFRNVTLHSVECTLRHTLKSFEFIGQFLFTFCTAKCHNGEDDCDLCNLIFHFKLTALFAT